MNDLNQLFLNQLATNTLITDRCFINEYFFNQPCPINRDIVDGKLVHTFTNWTLYSQKEQFVGTENEIELVQQIGEVIYKNLITVRKFRAIEEESKKGEIKKGGDIVVPKGYIVITTNDLKESLNYISETDPIFIDIDKYIKEEGAFKDCVFLINSMEPCGVFSINRLYTPSMDKVRPVMVLKRDDFHRLDMEINLYFNIHIENKENAYCYKVV